MPELRGKLVASPNHRPPACADDWIEVAARELKNLSGSYVGKLTNDAKVDHALKATEAVLKALIWKHSGWTEWPKRRTKGFSFLFCHKLEEMLNYCGLRSRLRTSLAHWASWQTLVNAVEKQARYSPTSALPSDAEANEVAKATRHPDMGIVPWLLKRYREMI